MVLVPENDGNRLHATLNAGANGLVMYKLLTYYKESFARGINPDPREAVQTVLRPRH